MWQKTKGEIGSIEITTPSLYREKEKEKLFFQGYPIFHIIFSSLLFVPKDLYALIYFFEYPQDLYHKPAFFRQYLCAMVSPSYSVPY